MDAKTLKTLRSLDSEKDLEHSGGTTKPNNCVGTDCRVTETKSSVGINCPKAPRKRQRGAGGPTETKRTKGKYCTEWEVPQKKQRVGRNNVDTGKLIEMTVEGRMAHGTKRKAGAESVTPNKKRREMDCDLSKSSSSPSASQQSNGSMATSVTICKPTFEDAYLQLEELREGGFGSVYAGKRKTDNLPVAIKRILKVDVESRPTVSQRRTTLAPLEALLMLRAGGGRASVGKCAAVSLIDWYDLDQEVILVMERPVPCVDLLTYLDNNNGPLREDQAKDIMKQLVKADIQMLSEEVFHRDIKAENILVQTDSDVPRVRIIDFGCGCFVRKIPYFYTDYFGTSAYAPPECYSVGRYEAGPTSVWQLGALLFELLDGHKQFNTSEFLQRKITLSSELSRDCQDLLQMCLAINPRGRATLEQMQRHRWFK